MKTLINNTKDFKHDLSVLIRFLKNNYWIKYGTYQNKQGEFVHNIITLQPKNFRYEYLTFTTMNNMFRYIDNFSIVEGFNI